MKYWILCLGFFIVSCASTQQQNDKKPNAEDDETIVFSAKQRVNEIILSCRPANEKVAVSEEWVGFCNSVAYEFLNRQVAKGLRFEKRISKKPFGMAAEFTAKLLKEDPSKIQVLELGQSFRLTNPKVI